MQLYIHFSSWWNNFIYFWLKFSNFNNFWYKFTQFYKLNLVNRLCEIFMFTNTSKWINYPMYFSIKSYMWIVYSKFNFNFRLNPTSKWSQYLSNSLFTNFANFSIEFFKLIRWWQHNNYFYKLTNPTITKQSLNKFQWLSKYFLYPLSI